jgi:ribonucleotide reductase alpha subunit
LFNLPLSQSYGRLIDGKMKDCKLYPENKDLCVGTNACSEVSLCNYEICNLAELYLNNIDTKRELIDCAKLLYKTQKVICSLNFLHKETNDIVHKNYRLGLGITGICQSFDKLEWLDDCYKELREFDKEWSKEKGYPRSIKLSTTKPSGTLSILSGSTPGVHPAYAKYYIRRIRMSSDDKLVEYCKNLGYRVEYLLNLDKTVDRNTVVIEFPCFAGEKVVTAKEMTAIQQLELLKKIQTIWSDNAVSCTIYYKKEELSEIKKWMKENYENSIKSVSFLLHSDHGFSQPPYEEISKEKYEELIKGLKPIKPFNLEGKELENMECSAGSCPIR